MDNETAILIQDLMRRVNNFLRPGTIADVDNDRAKVRVNLGETLMTTWLPFFARRAGNTIDWDPPEPGEQCLVLSPGGEMAGGFVLTGLYSATHPAPLKDPKVWLRRYVDGLECAYNHKTHSLTISRPEDLKLIVNATEMEFSTEKAVIKNKSGEELLSLISKGFKSIAKSQTATSTGPQPLQPASTELPVLAAKLDSFGG